MTIKDFFINKPQRAFFVLACLFNLEFILGPYAPVRIDDRFDIGFVAMKSIGENLLRHGLHFWDGSVISGVVTAASTGFSLFHPAVILSGIMPLWGVYFLWKIVAAFAAGYGMYLYLSRILRLSSLASFCGGLMMLAATRQHDIVSLFQYLFPMYLYCFDRCVNEQLLRNKFRYILVLTIIFISALPHVTIPFIPVIHLAMIIFFVRPLGLFKKYLIWFFCVWSIYIAVQSPTLYLLISEAAYSQRIEFQSYWLSNYYVGQWIVDNFFMPASMPNLSILLPTALCIISFVFMKSRILRFWWGFFIILFLIMSVTESSFGMSLHKYLGMLRVTRFSEVLPFVFCLLSSYGLYFLEKIYMGEKPIEIIFPGLKAEVVLKKIFPLVLLLLVILSVYLFLKNPSLVPAIMLIFFLFVPALCLTVYYFAAKKREWRWSSFALLAVVLFYLAGSRAEFTLRYTLIPYNVYFHNDIAEKIGRELEYGTDRFYRSASFLRMPYALQYHGLQTLDGNLGIYPVRFKHYWQAVVSPWLDKASKDERDYFLYYGPKVYLYHTPRGPNKFTEYIPEVNFNLLALGNVKYVFSFAPIKNPEQYNIRPYLFPESVNNKEYLKFLNLMEKITSVRGKLSFLNLKDLATFIADEKFDFFHFPQVVYVINNVLPRTFIVGNRDIFENERTALDALSRMSVPELSKKVVLIKSDMFEEALPVRQVDLKWSAKIVSYAPDNLKIAAATEKDAILILTDNFHRNWKAFLDGRSIPVFPAYVTFRGVIVPAGKHIVEFKYQDTKLMILYFISSAVLITIFVLPFIFMRSKKSCMDSAMSD